jgi:hypothetical protein
MAYEFLKDGTPFNAASLRTRFDALVSDVNAVAADAIQFLGLSPEVLPSFVGSGETVTETLTAENTSATVVTPSTAGTDAAGSPPLIDGSEFNARLQSGANFQAFKTLSTTGFSLQPRSAGEYSLDRALGEDEPTALLVMANVEVRQFEDVQVVSPGLTGGSFQVWGISLNEYEWDATVILELEDASGTKGYLRRTERQVSPRVTIGAVGNNESPDPPVEVKEGETVSGHGTAREDFLLGRVAMSPLRDYPGHTRRLERDFYPVVAQFDHRTHQDVSIRTVITKADLTRAVDSNNDPVTLSGIKHIRFGFGSLNERNYTVQRANISVIPLLSEVKVYA